MKKKPHGMSRRRRLARARTRWPPEDDVASLARQVTKLLTAEPDFVAEKAEKAMRKFFKIEDTNSEETWEPEERDGSRNKSQGRTRHKAGLN